MTVDPNKLALRAAIPVRRRRQSVSNAAGLKLVAAREVSRQAQRRTVGEPLVEPADPRWVLAIRIAQVMEGPILRPEKRQRMLRLGKVLGLSPFDSNLVMAIMQDQARRGNTPHNCPAAGAALLTMVPLPEAFRSGKKRGKRRRIQSALTIVATITSLIAAELFWFWWLFSPGSFPR
jgi:hypothetical protein